MNPAVLFNSSSYCTNRRYWFGPKDIGNSR